MRCSVAIVGSGFAGSLLARILARQGHDVVLLERGTHPRFAIGESTTPLANLSLERIARRYELGDCHQLAAHGRWVEHLPQLRRGLKRGFTFYRHRPNTPFGAHGLESARLLVAASPNDYVADSHWMRADVDHHFVQRAVEAGVDYRDRIELTGCEMSTHRARLTGTREGRAFTLDADFVVDASGPGSFLARQLSIADALDRTFTRSGLLYSHFENVRPMSELAPSLPDGPYPDDWAAVHHVIDEGWMYSLRFDDDVVSAGLVLREEGGRRKEGVAAAEKWKALVARYPTLQGAFGDARPSMSIRFVPRLQHRLGRASGQGWLLLPHTYAFVDPLFSTGIAWALRSIERVALMFERGAPAADDLARYDSLLSREADQIDRLVAGAYDAMVHFDLFVAHALIYFATVSYAETLQRVAPNDDAAWSGFIGVGDPAIENVPRESHERLRGLTGAGTYAGSAEARRAYVDWTTAAIAPRNVAGLADPARRNLYPVDLDVLMGRHDLLGLSRDQLVAALPTLRGAPPTCHPERSEESAVVASTCQSE